MKFPTLLQDHPDYPDRLLHLTAPPYKLYYQGQLKLLHKVPAVAVVGTRRPSTYGLRVAYELGRYLTHHGIPVVSGLARGIDAAVHRGSLELGGAAPIAVVGCGLDQMYPSENRSLQLEIARRGLVLSEYPPGSPPQSHHFPQRNRILAALAQLLIMVEAPAQSGALITVNQALDLGRDILVVPAPLHQGSSLGNLRLLREGAVPLCEFDDILSVLKKASSAGSGAPFEPSHSMVEGLSEAGSSVDELSQLWCLSIAETLERLVQIELEGGLERREGRYYPKLQR